MPLAIARPPLFAADWLVDPPYHEETLGVIKGGKESEVRLVARIGAERTSYIAEKRFKARGFRSFLDDLTYREDWFRGPGGARVLRGVRRGRSAGQQLLGRAWTWHEWTELRHLYDAGVTVPPPVEPVHPTARPPRLRIAGLAQRGAVRVEEAESGYRMAFIGDPPTAAPRLSSVRLRPEEATRVWRALLEEIALMLRAERVHGDLSAYNILYWRERPVLIDFSQTVDIVTHPAARDLLRRDLERLASYFVRLGVDARSDRAWEAIDAERALAGWL